MMLGIILEEDTILDVKEIGKIRNINGEFYIYLSENIDITYLEGYSHIKIFWWFDKYDKDMYRKVLECNPPYENSPRTGVFATRSPVSTNPIGLTTAKILEINRKFKRIKVTKLDSFDNSSVIKIKPYINLEDKVDNVVVPKWLEHWPQWINDKDMSYNNKNLVLKEMRSNILPKYLKCKEYKNRIIDVDESRRRFLSDDSIEKPEFDSIIGLPPAIGISKRYLMRNPRSTVGTIIHIYDYLRIIYSNIGVRYCPSCGKKINKYTPEEINEIINGFKDDTEIIIEIINNEIYYQGKVIGNTNLIEDIRNAMEDGKGAFILTIDDKEKMIFQNKDICYNCKEILYEVTPSTFSYNNRDSMCKCCNGFGIKRKIDVDKIISNPSLSILDGASKFWGKLRTFRENSNANWSKGEVLTLANYMNLDLEKPWIDLPEEFRKMVIWGCGELEVKFEYKNKNGRSGNITRAVKGAYNYLEDSLENNNSFIDEFIKEEKCISCNGERIDKVDRLIEISNVRYPEAASMEIKELQNFIKEIINKLTDEEFEKVKYAVEILYKKLKIYDEIGSPYLTLDRVAITLSGGKLQRINIVKELDKGMSNILYVLDEPFSALHPNEYNKFIKILKNIRNSGNTIVIVEHSEDVIRNGDWEIKLV